MLMIDYFGLVVFVVYSVQTLNQSQLFTYDLMTWYHKKFDYV